MTRIAFIGAGSNVFAKNLISDILSYSALADTEFALMDIDKHRLETTGRAARILIDKADSDASVETTTDRREALSGADYVLNMINVGGTEPFENEIRIPESYGVEQAIGDTLGPGGVFRALRTIPVMLELAADMEELCPDATLLNYTNPMAMVTWATEAATDIDVVGICHSVPHTISALAGYADVPEEEVEYWVAGINHMAWVLEMTHDGEDVYPALFEAMEDPEVWERDTVRFETMKHFGKFPSESSHHLSEYLPYFRTSEEEIERLNGDGYAARMPTATYLEGWKETAAERDDPDSRIDEEDLVIERSEEYASRIIHSMQTDTTRRMNLNVAPNGSLIDNLPEDACVEVPCLVDGTGVKPCRVGELPPQLAALNRSNVHVQERTVTAALEHDREAVFQAVKLDPLSGAVCTLDEIHDMTAELLEANAEYLPDFS